MKPEKNLKTRYEEIEDIASYANTLPDDAKRWLAAFSEEEICANFNHEHEKLNTSTEDKRRIYGRNNQRNRCVFTRQKAQGQDNMDYLEMMRGLEKDIVEDSDDAFFLDSSLFDDPEEPTEVD